MICPYKFFEALTHKLKEKDIVVCANGTACVAMFQAGIVKKGQRIFWNSGCASMGYALPASIGACIASDRSVISIEGDGSLMMNLQELQTVKHYDLPIKLFVLNNNGYHSLQETQENYFKGKYIGSTLKDISFPDFKKTAELFEMEYFYMQEEDHLNIDLDIVLKKRQVLCEVMLGKYKFRKQTI